MFIIKDGFGFFFSYYPTFNLILGVNYCWLTRFVTLLLLQTSSNGTPGRKVVTFRRILVHQITLICIV